MSSEFSATVHTHVIQTDEETAVKIVPKHALGNGGRMPLSWVTAGLWASMPPATKAVAGVLLARADVQGRCWPSVPRLATEAGVDRASVYRAIKWLQEARVLDRHRSPGKGNLYQLRPAADSRPVAPVRPVVSVQQSRRVVAAQPVALVRPKQDQVKGPEKQQQEAAADADVVAFLRNQGIKGRKLFEVASKVSLSQAEAAVRHLRIELLRGAQIDSESGWLVSAMEGEYEPPLASANDARDRAKDREARERRLATSGGQQIVADVERIIPTLSDNQFFQLAKDVIRDVQDEFMEAHLKRNPTRDNYLLCERIALR